MSAASPLETGQSVPRFRAETSNSIAERDGGEYYFSKIRAALPRSIRAKLLIVFLTLGAMTGLLGTYGICQIHNVGLITAETYDRPLMAINYARSAQVTFERLADTALDSRESAPDIESADDLDRSMAGDLNVVEQRASSPAAIGQVHHVQELSRRWLDLRKQLTQSRTADKGAWLHGGPISEELRQAFEKLSEQMAADGFVQRRLAMSASTSALQSSFFATSCAVIFALLMTLIMSRLIVAPLTAAAAVANRIAAGDIETPITSDTRDEAGALLSSMAYMQDKLLERRVQLQGQISAVTSAKEALRLAHDDIQKTAEKLGEANDVLLLAGRMAQLGHWRMDVGKELECSEEVYRIYGIPISETPQSFIGSLEGYHSDDWPKIGALTKKAFETGEGFNCEVRIIRRDGVVRDATIWCRTEQAVDGQVTGIFGVLQDTTDGKAAERENAKLSERIRLATDAGQIGVWEWSIFDNNFIADKRMFEMYGLDPSVGHLNVGDLVDRLHPDDMNNVATTLDEAISSERLCNSEYRVVWTNGNIRHLKTRGSILFSPAGKPERIVGVVWDVTELRTLTEQLHEEKERLQITLSSIGDAVIATDNESRITFMNPVAEKLTGWNLAEVFGQPLREFFHLVDDETGRPVQSPVERCLTDRAVVKLEDGVSLIGRDGSRCAISDSVGPVRTQSGDIIGAVLVFQDVSRAREMQKALTFSASHDALTGLLNRAKFESDCQTALDLVKRSLATHALCFVDLDRFKLVNDTAGHAAGDMMLREIAAALVGELRSTDIIARLGGDEFGFLLRDCPVEKAKEICSKIISIISAIRLPWEGKMYDVGASIGIAMVTAEATSLGELMSQADVACYASKHGGRNRATLYHASQSEAGDKHREMFQAAGLKSAIENNRFILYAQEIVSTSDISTPLRHIELLLRMVDDEGHIILPGALIPAAERYGLMMSIDRWVINEALIKLGPEIAKRHNLRIAINLSGNSLSDPHLLNDILVMIAQSPVPPEALQFEITETAVMSHLSIGSKLVEALQSIGCTVALDDFGSGISSFTYLKNFKADFIKIDGNFVRNMDVSATDLAIVESINTLAHRLGVKTVAESVESENILNKLRLMGADYAQGYAISSPVPLVAKLKDIDLTAYGFLPISSSNDPRSPGYVEIRR